MEPIRLTENGGAVEVALSADQAGALRASELVTLTPGYTAGSWLLSPRQYVGVAQVCDVELWIAPKLPIRRLLFLLGYAYDVRAWRTGDVHVAQDTELLPAMATAFARAAEKATDQGLIQGYRTTEEAATVLRGRIRTDEQLRRRFGLPMPLEIRYDDYTADIPENRILRAAAERLLRLPRIPTQTRHALLRLIRLTVDVTPLGRGAAVPSWVATRLNARYQPALRLAELILRSASVEHAGGRVLVDGFMLDMARVFEQFLTVALREALTDRGHVEGQSRWHLDAERRIELKPDIVWYPRRGGPPGAVADAKYKAAKPSGYPNADVYQMLAYCTRLGLTEGHLVYAKGETTPGRHHVLGAPVTIVRHALDLDTTPRQLLRQVAVLARGLAPEA